MIVFTGTIDIDPEQRDVFVEAVRKATPLVRGEAGCESFAFSADLEDENRFHLSEQWADEETLAAHNTSAHMLEFRQSMGPLVRGGGIVRWDGATGTQIMGG